MKDLVTLPETEEEVENLKRAGYPVVFTVDQWIEFAGVIRYDFIRLSHDKAHPVMYQFDKFCTLVSLDSLSVLPNDELWIGNPKYKNTEPYSAIGDMAFPAYGLFEQGRFKELFMLMPAEYRFDMFLHNFHRIPTKDVCGVFFDVFGDTIYKLDNLPSYIKEYVTTAPSEAIKKEKIPVSFKITDSPKLIDCDAKTSSYLFRLDVTKDDDECDEAQASSLCILYSPLQRKESRL